MSTPTTTPTPTSTSDSRPTGWIITTVIAAGLALAGIIAALFMVFGSPAHASKTNDFFYPGDSTTTSGGTGGGGTGGHHNRPNPPARPSQTIKLLQEQLGQLNYYNGPATGYLNNS